MKSTSIIATRQRIHAMDADRFDALLGALATAPSRRAALRVLGGLGLAGLFGQTDAKKKHKKKKKKCAKAGQSPSKKRKRCCQGLAPDGSGVCVSPSSPPPPAPLPPPPCVPNCAGKDCGPNGCGSVCGSCVGGICTDGTCLCPSGTKNCGGACFPTNTDPRNCGDCGRRCHLNEQCIAGQCTCFGSSGNLLCFPGRTCCPEAGICDCTLDPNGFLNPLTCVVETGCPTGATPCVATSNTCTAMGQSGPARVCCPNGTTCTAEGTCLL